MLPVLILLTASVYAQETTPDHVRAWRDQIDWDQAEAEGAAVLSGYLQVDSVNPTGHEARAVRYLVKELAKDGLRATEYPLDPAGERSNLVAHLRGDGTGGGPICLLSHLDVVTSEPERWTPGIAPLSGEIRDGYIWGRGALDMKGMTVVELQAMRQLARLGAPLTRDIVLIAVADEEIDNLGMRELVSKHWQDVQCEVILNEGGLGIQDALFDGQTVHAISVAEKGVLWGRLWADGEAGHGSSVRPNEAPTYLLAGVNAVLKNYRTTYTFDPALVELLRRAGAHEGGAAGVVLRSKPLRGLIVKPKLKKIPGIAALLQDTLHLTGFSGANQPNVVPSHSYAQFDSRLRPGTSPEAQKAKLEALIADLPGLHWEWLSADPANGSSWEDPFFRALAYYAVEDRPYAVSGPVLSPGFTDSLLARPLGVKAYGYVPFEVTQDEAETMHGHDERVSVANVREGTRRLLSTLLHLAVDPSAAPKQPAASGQ